MLKVYSAEEVAANLAGIPISAQDESDFVAITKPNDTFIYKRGMNGFGTRARVDDKFYLVTITLPQTSEINAALSALHKLDLLNNGAGVGVFTVVDTNSNGTVLTSPEAFIIKMPDFTAAAEAGTVQWQIACHNTEFTIGGN